MTNWETFLLVCHFYKFVVITGLCELQVLLGTIFFVLYTHIFLLQPLNLLYNSVERRGLELLWDIVALKKAAFLMYVAVCVYYNKPIVASALITV